LTALITFKALKKRAFVLSKTDYENRNFVLSFLRGDNLEIFPAVIRFRRVYCEAELNTSSSHTANNGVVRLNLAII